MPSASVTFLIFVHEVLTFIIDVHLPERKHWYRTVFTPLQFLNYMGYLFLTVATKNFGTLFDS